MYKKINNGNKSRKTPSGKQRIRTIFFTEKVLDQITNTFLYEDNILCLCTPSVADAFWKKNKAYKKWFRKK